MTDEVMAETVAWQNRPLDRMYPVVFFDALRVKIRSDGLEFHCVGVIAPNSCLGEVAEIEGQLNCTWH